MPLDSSLPIMASLSEVLLELHRGGRDLPHGEFEPLAFAGLDRLVPHDAGVLASGVLVDGIPYIHDQFLHRLPSNFVEDWHEVRGEDRATAEAMARPGRTVSHASREVHVGAPDILARVLSFGLEHVLLTVTIDQRVGLCFAFAIYRKDRSARFTEEERQTTELFVPHAIEALRTSRLARLRAEATSSTSPTIASAIVDAKGLVLEAEPAFGDRLDLAFDAWKGPFLPEPLRDLVREGRPGRRIFRRLAFSLTIHGEQRLLRVRQATIVDGLTSRELEVARCFSTGASSEETGSTLGIATNTVRAHLGRVYSKLGVENRAELATLLAGYD